MGAPGWLPFSRPQSYGAETSIESRPVNQVSIFRKGAGRGESQDGKSLHLAKIPQQNCKNCRPTFFHQKTLGVHHTGLASTKSDVRPIRPLGWLTYSPAWRENCICNNPRGPGKPWLDPRCIAAQGSGDRPLSLSSQMETTSTTPHTVNPQILHGRNIPLRPRGKVRPALLISTWKRKLNFSLGTSNDSLDI